MSSSDGVGYVNNSVIRNINNSFDILHSIVVLVICIGSVAVIFKLTKTLSEEVTCMSLY